MDFATRISFFKLSYYLLLIFIIYSVFIIHFYICIGIKKKIIREQALENKY